MLWDLLQQCQISRRHEETKALASRAHTLSDRVTHLEKELKSTRAQLRLLTELLEGRLGEDLNGDGKVGR